MRNEFNFFPMTSKHRVHNNSVVVLTIVPNILNSFFIFIFYYDKMLYYPLKMKFTKNYEDPTFGTTRFRPFFIFVIIRFS